MSSDAIEGGPNHLKANPIFSPSMPTLDVSPEPISKPIIDPDDSLYALFLSLMMILEIPSIGIMKDPRMTKKSNDND